MKNKIFITGAAGFIGYHLCKRLINNGELVIGFDNLNSYYDITLKINRIKDLDQLKTNNKWKFYKGNLEDIHILNEIFTDFNPNIVINLAAQAGVRYSLENPFSYISSNIVGFQNLLEVSKNFKIKSFLYASSSSVYGGNTKVPFSEKDNVDHPLNLYAATKKANELIAHSYSHLYDMPTTGLRFFTVYGPWGRPDMVPMIFAKKILNREYIPIFNSGNMYRDFTYIDDVIEALFNLIYLEENHIDSANETSKDSINTNINAKYRILNIGNGNSISLMKFIEILENELGIKASKKFMPMQKGDIKATFSDSTQLQKLTGFKPSTSLEVGIKEFVSWYKNYYKIN